MNLNFFNRLGETSDLPNNRLGNIIHAETTPQLFQKVGEDNRLLTYRELLEARVHAFGLLANNVPGINEIPEMVESKSHTEALPIEIFNIMANVRHHIWSNVSTYAVWLDRYTTSTSIVRGNDEMIYFWDYQILGEDITEAIKQGLCDGGFNYAPWMQQIKEQAYARIELEEYLKANGGSFSSDEWLRHPVFKAACNEEELHQEYVKALDILSADSFHKPGLHSGWVQTGFPEKYGRPVAAGLGEATFYPPNNLTIGHSGITINVLG